MANYLVTDTELTSVADAIRTKGGTSADLEFPDGFVTAIGNISGGGGNLGTKTISSNGTYEAEDDGYDGYSEVTVSVPTGTARTSSDLTASGATVTAPAGLYASAASKSVASGSATTPATTITANPTISVNSSTGLITASVSKTQSITPTVSAGYVSSGTAGTITVSGSDTSQLTVKDSDDLTFASRVFTAPAGYYPEAATKTIAEGTFTTQVGDPDSTGLIAYSTYTSSGWYANATLSGTKQLSTQAAQTIHPSTSDQTVASGKWLTGAQTIKAVTMTNLTAGNIKKDVVVKIGDSTDDDCVTSVTGTYEGGGGLTLDDVADPNGLTGAAVVSTSTTFRDYAFAYSKISSFSSTSITQGKQYAFSNCQSLTSVNLPNITSLATSMFTSCTALTSIYLPSVTGSTQINSFKGCTSLQTAVFPLAGAIGNACFSGCTALTGVDVGGETGNNTGIDQNAFQNASQLTTLVIRTKNSVRKLSNVTAFSGTPFANGGTGGTIYIPKVMYDHLGDNGSYDYKKATNWSTVNGYGTITWAKIEGSIYETKYVDGTTIPT